MQLSQIEYGRTTAAENMALDAAMLEAGYGTGCALWRTYGWTEPAITFGYSQRWAWVQDHMEDQQVACVRRSTGGGIVDHRADLTYSLTIPPHHTVFRTPARQIYRQLHQQVADTLEELGVPATLAECEQACGETNSVPGVCFESPEPFDVIAPHSNTKLAGAAMRRSQSGILIQGSLDMRQGKALDRIQFAEAFGSRLASWLQTDAGAFQGCLPPDILKTEIKRYSSREWNQKR